MEYETLRMDVNEDIAVITISRPQALNALNDRVLEELDCLIADVGLRDNLKVLILTGDGKAFAAGADIAEIVSMTQEQATEFSRRGQATLERLELLSQPVIAAVNGFALGGGCELAMACDIRIASEKAKFGQPEVGLGLIPGYAATQWLPRLIGMGNALHLLLTAETIGAEEALRLGLVQKVVGHDQLLSASLEMAKTIASKGPKAVRLVKRVARRGFLGEFDAGCALESEAFGTLFQNEGAEGMRAFLEKRPPRW